MPQQNKTISQFSLNGVVLFLTAPDDPEAMFSARAGTPLWGIEATSADGEIHGERTASGDASPKLIARKVVDLLYKVVPYDAVDVYVSEIQSLVESAHGEYLARVRVR